MKNNPFDFAPVADRELWNPKYQDGLRLIAGMVGVDEYGAADDVVRKICNAVGVLRQQMEQACFWMNTTPDHVGDIAHEWADKLADYEELAADAADAAGQAKPPENETERLAALEYLAACVADVIRADDNYGDGLCEYEAMRAAYARLRGQKCEGGPRG